MDVIPYIIHESEMARQERHIKRLWILCIIIFAAFVITNVGWVWYESQFEDIVLTQEGVADGNGNVRLNGVAEGNIYGEGQADDQSTEAQDWR